MQPARIAELLAPFLDPASGQRLTTNDLDHISTYIDILLRWNARINLTAIRDPEQIVTRHFGESFFTAGHLFPRNVRVGADALEACPERPRGTRGSRMGPAERSSAALPTESTKNRPNAPTAEDYRGRAALQGRVEGRKEVGALAPEARRVADLGSGAGFPGLPIKLWAPHISLTLIESNHKKVAFLREVCRSLTLTDINIQNVRAEALTGTTYDVVTLRAVERFHSILPVAARLLSSGGRLALLIGSAQQPEAKSLLPDLSWSAPVSIPSSQSRILLVAMRS